MQEAYVKALKSKKKPLDQQKQLEVLYTKGLNKQ
jgi:hypothetical protein